MSDLFWHESGTGRPLVFLHGGFLHHEMWDAQLSVFAAKYRVIAPDARGHGHSPNATGPFRHCDDVADLLRHLDTGPAVLIGVSMGGATAVDTALEHPELVDALVVSGVGTSSPYFTDPWTTDAWTRWQTAMAAGDLETSIDVFTEFAAGPHRRLSDLDGELVDRLRAMTRTTMSKHTADEPDWQTPMPDPWTRATGITVPVLAVNGAIDSPDHLGMAERLIDTVPDGRIAAIDNAAHYPNLEHPARFNELVEDFLDRTPARGPSISGTDAPQGM